MNCTTLFHSLWIDGSAQGDDGISQGDRIGRFKYLLFLEMAIALRHRSAHISGGMQPYSGDGRQYQVNNQWQEVGSMALTQTEFEALLSDGKKRIEGDIVWQRDEDHSPCFDFRAEVLSASGWPLFVRGSFNPLIPALTFALILKTEGRIYALDLGKDHHNPQCNRVGDCHKHRWSDQFRDKEAYAPEDITAPAENPLEVWRQFCTEARIDHQGRMMAPPPQTGELFL